MERKPVVAGQFYPRQANLLKKEIESYIIKNKAKREVKGILSPHAGYIYSGRVAGAVFSQIKIPDTYLILGPNHTGEGRPFALWEEGTWQTPLGSVEIDKELTKQILNQSSLIEADYQAHLHEHSLEVQLPFIQYLSVSAKIVPLVLGFGTFPQLKEISQAIAKVIKSVNKKVVIVASSDMTHYQPQEVTEKQDHLALQPLLNLEAQKFYETVLNNNISMCGFIPAAVMILTSQTLGAKKGELVMYTTSGETSGDYFQVVGYAGVIVE